MQKHSRPKHFKLFQEGLIDWYRLSGRKFPWRRKNISLYQKIISEVLLQRTKTETIASYFESFIERFPGWKSLAAVQEVELENFLKPIGLWRRRAVSIKALSIEMASRGGRFPKTREEVEALPGVGQYICNSILLFCHGQSEPLLDVNMARVLERYFGPRKLADIRYDPYLNVLSRQVLEGVDPIKMNWAILDFASIVCKVRIPDCEKCSLSKNCLFFNGSMQP